MPETTQKARRVRSRSVPETPATLAQTPAARATIEAQGGQVTPLGEWIGLNEVEMKTIDLRIGLIEAIIRLRSEAKLTQAALAKRLGVARPRIAEIEARKPQVSFDSLLPAFWAVGGTTTELIAIVQRTDDSMRY